MTFCVQQKKFETGTHSDVKMNSKKLECFDDNDSVDEKLNLSFLGKFKKNLAW